MNVHAKFGQGRVKTKKVSGNVQSEMGAGRQAVAAKAGGAVGERGLAGPGKKRSPRNFFIFRPI